MGPKAEQGSEPVSWRRRIACQANWPTPPHGGEQGPLAGVGRRASRSRVGACCSAHMHSHVVTSAPVRYAPSSHKDAVVVWTRNRPGGRAPNNQSTERSPVKIQPSGCRRAPPARDRPPPADSVAVAKPGERRGPSTPGRRRRLASPHATSSRQRDQARAARAVPPRQFPPPAADPLGTRCGRHKHRAYNRW